MVVSSVPLPCQLASLDISLEYQKLKLESVVLHATVKKLTAWKPFCPFLPKVASRKVRPINILKRYDSYGSPPGKRGVKNTKSSHPDNITHTAESISPQLSTSSVLPWATPVFGYTTDTFSLHHGNSTLPSLRCTTVYLRFDLSAAHMYHPGLSSLSSHQ